MKLIKHDTIPASYCDADVKLSVVGAFQIVEDLVTEMMGELSIDGLVCMNTYKAMWIFVRNRIEMRHSLAWKEPYTAECYISSIGKAKLNVDTVLKNAENAVALASRLELCAVDLKTMKLRKTETVGLDGRIIAEEAKCEIKYERGKFIPDQCLDTVTVRSSDIDYCHHTNNISYVRYLMNQRAAAEHSRRPVRVIEVQYAGQTHEGDELQICSCKGTNENKGREYYAIRHNDETVLNCLVVRDGKPDKEIDADDPYMRETIAEALEGIYSGHGGPFGSVIVKDGVIVGRGHNMVLANTDSTAHGEIIAIRDAEKKLGTYDLSGCVLYTTGEPCPMCLYAVLWANIDKVYYGCTIKDNAEIGFRDEIFDELSGGREALKEYLTCIDRDACLKLFKVYMKMKHGTY